MVRCSRCGHQIIVHENSNIGFGNSLPPIPPIQAGDIERDGCVMCMGGDAPCARCGELALIPVTDKTERRYAMGIGSDDNRPVYRCLSCYQFQAGRHPEPEKPEGRLF